MKKLLVLAIILALGLATCGDGSTDNSDLIGKWVYSHSPPPEVITLEIFDGIWSIQHLSVDWEGEWDTYTDHGTWAHNGKTINLYDGSSIMYTARLSSIDELILEEKHWTVNEIYKLSRVKPEPTPPTPPDTSKTTLTINNQSFTEIADVIWNNVSFANNQYEKSIKSGTTVTKTVQAGAGYIFFKRKTSPITARTRDLVVLEKDQQVEFVFRDNTLIVEVGNTNNTGTLGTVQSTVVWWDDAEGEMQPYTLKQSFVGYYKDNSALSGIPPTYSNPVYYFYPPKNGNKSIGIGGTNTAMLQLKINLEKNAKLSFWYANKYLSSSTAGTTFSINGDEKAKWTTDVDWSFLTFDLEAGENDLKWEKKDGYYSSGNTHFYYLSLDDILIYYME